MKRPKSLDRVSLVELKQEISHEVINCVRLTTHNGGIICKQVSGGTELNTYNGSVDVDYSKSASAICIVSIVTHNASIDLSTPPNFSGAVDVSTHNGSIKTDLPITIVGDISRNRFTGKIGTGEGKLHLETPNGSIKIR